MPALLSSGKIDSAILASFGDVKVNDLIQKLKQKDFQAVRKWVVSNLDNDPGVLLRRVYDALYNTMEGPSIAAAVLIIAKYQYQIAFVADQEINLLAALTEIMVECNFNKNLINTHEFTYSGPTQTNKHRGNMATNPYELRWELFQSAEMRVTKRHDEAVLRWQSLTEKGEDAGPYPEFPTEQEILEVANMMRHFIEGN